MAYKKDEREPTMIFMGEKRDGADEEESEEMVKLLTPKDIPLDVVGEESNRSGKIDWKAYLTCGNCMNYRDLNVSEDERKAYESQNIPIPKVCGAYPPTVMMVIVPVGGLSPEAGKMVQKPQNFWPFPPANEPSCSLFQANRPHSDFLIKEG